MAKKKSLKKGSFFGSSGKKEGERGERKEFEARYCKPRKEAKLGGGRHGRGEGLENGLAVKERREATGPPPKNAGRVWRKVLDTGNGTEFILEKEGRRKKKICPGKTGKELRGGGARLGERHCQKKESPKASLKEKKLLRA